MRPAASLSQKRYQNPMLEVFLRTGLYHSFRLPDGRVLQGTLTLEQLEARLKAFGLPDDLTGKRVLDIGPWDGYFTFEMERRGAEVVAIDYVDLDTFRELHRAFDSQAEYHRMDVYELEPHKFGMFDIVLCLGVLYHLKHPLLALEKICAITREICVVDSFVCDGEEYLDGQRPHLPYIEFYENDQLAGQLDNWCGPSVTAVEALVRAAGFARARLQRVTERTAIVAADRKWGALPVSEPPLELVGLHCHAHGGKYFQSQKEEYFAILCRWSQPEAPPLETVFPEVDQYGVAPLACKLTPAGLAVSARVPPGLTPGEHTVRLKIGPSGWSDPIAILFDLPPSTGALELVSTQDSATWKIDQIDWGNGGYITLWVKGLSAQADIGNTTVYVAGVPHSPEALVPDTGQINIKLRPVVRAGTHQASVVHLGNMTAPRTIQINGSAPPIHGLEALRS